MSRALPVMIDPFRLAASERALDGTIPIRHFKRLVPLLADAAGDVEVRLSFRPGPEDRPEVNGRMDVQVEMTCQRCLDRVRIPIETTFSLLIVGSETEAEKCTDDIDFVVLEGRDSIRCVDLLEDELLLQLPLVAKHEDSNECASPMAALVEQEAPGAPDEQAKHPFAVLERLKK